MKRATLKTKSDDFDIACHWAQITLDDLWKKVNEQESNPKHDPEVYWLKTSIINALELYYCDFLKKDVKLEARILHRVWWIVYLCFDNDSRITVTSNKTINELELKCPKTMEDNMLLRMVRIYPGIQHDLMTCDFNISAMSSTYKSSEY
ncbi:hypothetical protein BDA99DRAFT_532903 [Phascolomyces articulosus]|uniref:Uncharacterized protein n=1 Tax=Phascolomyces articulosus TaxID=60185 RepID=A0AAD5KMM9_9FUNG|nr:hypothetical protein BDA99DRAFT_532903 [Phascolomyces articulosus]